MRSRLSRSEADDAGLHSTIRVGAQRSAETACFVVGMGSDAHEPKHGEIVSDVQSFAEMVQLVARISLN